MDEGTWDYFPCVSLIHYTLIHHTHTFIRREREREKEGKKEEKKEKKERRRKP